jgi:hypothetical protein
MQCGVDPRRETSFGAVSDAREPSGIGVFEQTSDLSRFGIVLFELSGERVRELAGRRLAGGQLALGGAQQRRCGIEIAELAIQIAQIGTQLLKCRLTRRVGPHLGQIGASDAMQRHGDINSISVIEIVIIVIIIIIIVIVVNTLASLSSLRLAVSQRAESQCEFQFNLWRAFCFHCVHDSLIHRVQARIDLRQLPLVKAVGEQKLFVWQKRMQQFVCDLSCNQFVTLKTICIIVHS